MNFYFNCDGDNFRSCLKRIIYVDKSMLIKETNFAIEKQEKFLCVSRPRRFGKSFNADMLIAYYTYGDNTKQIFSNLNIAKDPSFEKHLNKYNMLSLNPLGFKSVSTIEKSVIYWMQYFAIKEMKKDFPNIEIENFSLKECIQKIYEFTGRRFVIIIDEYDFVFREYPSNKEIQKEYLDFLNDIFKDGNTARCLALVYLTGIMPIMKENTQSKLNNFTDISMIQGSKFSDFIGFDEIEVKTLCDKYKVDFNKMKLWYDGYDFGNNHNIYNPNSVVKAINEGEFADYWTQTSSSETIDPFIDSNFEGVRDDVIKLIAGQQVKVSPSDFNNTIEGIRTREDVFTYFIHLGYLTYRKDKNNKTFGYVTIPNFEILTEFQNRIRRNKDYVSAYSYIEESEKLLEETIDGNKHYVSSTLEKFHEQYSSVLKYNDENSLSCVITLAYFFARQKYTIIREFPSGKGFADLAFTPFYKEDPALLIEMKVDASANTALDQIKDKNYPQSLDKYKKNLILVGISYDRKTKQHTCKIEKMEQNK